MADGIDYAYNAPHRIALALRTKDETKAQTIALIAQAEATLALVEQQRIANLIAFLGTRSPSPETQGRIRDEIRKGLGL